MKRLIKNKISEIIDSLETPNPRLDARLLISFCLDMDYNDIYLKDDLEISDEQNQDIDNLVSRRKNGEPISKIIGKKDFWDLTFIDTEHNLSPRPDTETLIEAVLGIAKNPQNILDIGTGSGCIIITLLSKLKTAKGTTIDISSDAINIAKQNAKLNNVENRLEFINESIFEHNFKDKKFDIIVSNPPYIPTKDIKELDDDVKNYDPMLALDGGETGLDFYEQLPEILNELLDDNGLIFLEIGIGQEQGVENIFKNNGFVLNSSYKDLSGIIRCLELRRK